MNKLNRYLKWISISVVGNRAYKNNGKWVFGEWFGNKCCDNCLYFANYTAANHPEIECVWIAKKNTDLSRLDNKVKRVVMDTPEAMSIVNNADILFMNQGFRDFTENPDALIKGPLTVNFWHGVAWKRIGLDGVKTKNPLKKLYYSIEVKMFAPYFFNTLSEPYSEVLFSACGAKKGRVIKAGAPRNSIFYDVEKVLKCKEDIKRRLGLDINTKIVMYMPTFRDGNKETFSFNSVRNDEALRRLLKLNNAVLIEKSHFAERNPQKKKDDERIFFRNDFAAQELLAASDILITDYSSCFFDYLILDKPIIHYLYDYDYYAKKDRGLYYAKEDVACGECPEKYPELLEALKEAFDNPNKESSLRKRRLHRFMQYESSDSCKIIADYLIKTRGR